MFYYLIHNYFIQWYRNNEAQSHRLVPWLNRELNAVLSITGQQSRQAHLITQIVDWIKIYSIGSQELTQHLLPYLATNTEHFQHELLQFARSPYDMVGYDRHVKYDRRRVATEVVSSDSEHEQEAREVARAGDRAEDRDDYFVTEIRNRVQAMVAERDILDRIRRRGTEGGLGLGGAVTNYPERRQEAAGSRAERRHEAEAGERRGEIRRQPRQEHSQRNYLREVERLWGGAALSTRDSEAERQRDSRRKKRKPSRFQRPGPLSFGAAEVVEGDESPLDLSVAEIVSDNNDSVNIVDLDQAAESQPSTSRGHSSGLTRLVIPDSGSEDESNDSGDDDLIVDDVEEDASPSSIAVDILNDIVLRITASRSSTPHDVSSSSSSSASSSCSSSVGAPHQPEDTEAAGSSLSTFTGQVLSNFMANQMQNQLPTSLGERTFNFRINIQYNQSFN